MTSQLARHLTPWKGWYALLAVPAFLLGSLVMTVSELTGSSPDAPRETVTALLVPVQFIALAVLALAFLAVAARRWPTTRDLALVPGLTKRDLVVLAVVFVVTHVIFWLLTLGEPADPRRGASVLRGDAPCCRASPRGVLRRERRHPGARLRETALPGRDAAPDP